ncbi:MULTISPECIES: hypothetical protein [Streptomyces]|uniref:hypothetical protein n=1 Tax=Streptomyces TaxID=1883 RepID=UPI00292DEA7C|nr:hypothetical protein [Streptomyces sp. NEAU-HV9]
MTGARTASARTVALVSVPVGSSLAMPPYSLDVTVPANAAWQAGDLVMFALHFDRGGAVKFPAVVVRPGWAGP